MKESIHCEDDYRDHLVKYLYFPIRDESLPMSRFMMSEERRRELNRVGEQMRKYLEELPVRERDRRLNNLMLMREGLTPWQIINCGVPIEIRIAYDACGRLKKKG